MEITPNDATNDRNFTVAPGSSIPCVTAKSRRLCLNLKLVTPYRVFQKDFKPKIIHKMKRKTNLEEKYGIEIQTDRSLLLLQ